ncbi:hypothetical protein B5M42_021700 [Paenibacillus athensensis]|uniref:Uncharacterized protein n=1 Tax=Paenibacillus athensensis TaxID=1967502 RepID=A0A4Y8Q2T3_9BACL|nr:hypothetical protein [Paenibacillus athensensis]MCD1261420.1 hypothetical protein [Paenibacillus athensensis]
MLSINLDKVLAAVLKDMEEATTGWLKGDPSSEEAFLNRITEKLSARRRCDVGLLRKKSVVVESYNLHRKGPRQTDKFGSDFAITVDIPSDAFTKTALFQIKKSHNFTSTIEKRQLEQALLNNPIGKRSFVLSVDDPKGAIRIQEVEHIYGQFPKNVQSSAFHIEDWYSLGDWLVRWMDCKVGAGNRPQDPPPIEALLENEKIEGMQAFDFGGTFDLPRGYKITRKWFKFIFG